MRARSLIVLVFLAPAAGCGGGRDRYVPPEALARRSLELALATWRDGLPPGRIETGPPAVEFVDTHRRPGQRLKDFAVLGPTPGDAARCYAVRLTLENPRAEQKARFVVMGQDPLWVVRYEDFEMMSHWDHPMGDDKPKK